MKHGLSLGQGITLAGLGTSLLIIISLLVPIQQSAHAGAVPDGDIIKLKEAITGNTQIKDAGIRVDFGFVGTMGNVPRRLSDLWRKNSQPDFAFNSKVNLATGWVGPYITDEITNRMAVFDTDRNGHPYVYSAEPFTRGSDQKKVAVRIQSIGPDGIAGTPDDVIEDVLYDEIYGTVTGRVTAGGNPISLVAVTLNLPGHGDPTERKTSTDSLGMFAFEDVPFGRRSISVAGKSIPVVVQTPSVRMADIPVQGGL